MACNTALVLGLSWQVACARALLHLDLAGDHLGWDGKLEWDWVNLGCDFRTGSGSPAEWKGPEAEAVWWELVWDDILEETSTPGLEHPHCRLQQQAGWRGWGGGSAGPAGRRWWAPWPPCSRTLSSPASGFTSLESNVALEQTGLNLWKNWPRQVCNTKLSIFFLAFPHWNNIYL